MVVSAGLVTRLYPRQLPRGVPVPAQAVYTRSTAPGAHTPFAYGLALAGSAATFGTYPVKSQDAGRDWVVAGPKMHIAAAQGGTNLIHIAVASGRVAAAWGEWLVLTTDGGAHWWGSTFHGLFVQSVTLTATAGFLADVRGAGFVWHYQSTDGGRTWHLERPDEPCAGLPSPRRVRAASRASGAKTNPD